MQRAEPGEWVHFLLFGAYYPVLNWKLTVFGAYAELRVLGLAWADLLADTLRAQLPKGLGFRTRGLGFRVEGLCIVQV